MGRIWPKPPSKQEKKEKGDEQEVDDGGLPWCDRKAQGTGGIQEKNSADQAMEEWEIAWQAYRDQEILEAEWQAAAEDGLIEDMYQREGMSGTSREPAPAEKQNGCEEEEGRVRAGKSDGGEHERTKANVESVRAARKKRRIEATVNKKTEARKLEEEAIAMVVARLTKRRHDGSVRASECSSEGW